jgi:uncharacterized protein (DUF433 family)
VVVGLDVCTAPLYTHAEAARIVGVPSNTFGNWSRGYSYRTTEGEQTALGLITVAGHPHGRLTIPFVGLAEAYVINSLRLAGIPMLRIRPAVERLRDEMGVADALLSERLKTDGVEVLSEYVGDEGESVDGRVGLAVVRNKQGVFREAVADYLRTIRYSNRGTIDSILPKRYGDGTVIVDPHLNAGQPSFVESGVRVQDVERRVRAGESLDAVAEDFDIPLDIAELVFGTGRTSNAKLRRRVLRGSWSTRTMCLASSPSFSPSEVVQGWTGSPWMTAKSPAVPAIARATVA